MTNDEKLKKIHAWQNSIHTHPMECSCDVEDSRERELKGEVLDGKVVLRCPNCNEVQTFIPPYVLGERD